MNQLRIMHFDVNQSLAFDELKKNLLKLFPITTIILYGSYARREQDGESDIDLLIVTERVLLRHERNTITDIVFEINLKYDTNFSTLVVDNDSWESGYFTVLPIKQEILKDGVKL